MNFRTPLPNSLCYHAGKWETLGSGVVVETPVTLTINGHVWLTFMCTPTDLEALAVGFIYNEGVIKSKEEIELVKVCSSGDNVYIWLNNAVEQPQHWRRTSGCTGGVTAASLDKIHPKLKDGLLLSPQMVHTLIKSLTEEQVLYREVGGVHTSILSDGERGVVSAEDIGRHNSLDKIAGRCLLENIELVRKILVTTVHADKNSHVVKFDSTVLNGLIEKDPKLNCILMRKIANAAMERLAYAWVQLAAAWAK